MTGIGIIIPQEREHAAGTIPVGYIFDQHFHHPAKCAFLCPCRAKLGQYGGDYAIGAYGIINCVLICIVMIVLGLSLGMQPIAGYNYGAGQYGRALQAFQYTIVAATTVTSLGFLVGEFFPHQISSAFTSNKELIDLSIYGMRLAVLMFPVVGFQMVTSNFFQSIGRARISIFLSLSRQALILIPALLVLPHFFGLTGVWLAIPLSDLSAAVLAFLVLKGKGRLNPPPGYPKITVLASH